MAKRCVIISGGEFSDAVSFAAEDLVIACDRGYEYAKRLGAAPGLIVGDFDSYEGALPEGVPVLRLPREKDDTDTMHAVRCALERGCDEIVLTCALGGRLDHALANLQSCVYALRQGARVSICDESAKVFFLEGGSLTLPAETGRSLSLLSFSPRCEGVGISGVKYPLDNAVLESDFPLGVSNEWTESQALVSVGSGTLMVVLAKE